MVKQSWLWTAFVFVERVLVGIERATIFVTFLGMAFFVFAGIVARQANIALAWTNEAAQLLLVWLIFAGTNLGTYYQEHVAVLILPNALSGRAKTAIILFDRVVIAVFSAYIVVASIKFVQMQRMIGGTTFALPIDIPKYLIALILPFSFFAGTVHAIHNLAEYDRAPEVAAAARHESASPSETRIGQI